MIVFVVILGAFTSVLLLGMNALTSDRIAANDEAKLKATVLDAYEIAYTYSNINEIFDENVTVYEVDGNTFYQDERTGYVTFRFEGGGVWGPIIGLITLEDDLETIVYISILEQEETPGLGGVVAERNYLNNFVGKQMEIDIVKDAENLGDDQVDSITGATRTSDAFENILNNTYQSLIPIWENSGN
jgi:Na+-transporting NADH:ubiquinone oxidoreductase subunit C